jgi:hypothetical protein
MAVAGLPRLWGAAKLETSDVRLGPELDDIVVVSNTIEQIVR